MLKRLGIVLLAFQIMIAPVPARASDCGAMVGFAALFGGLGAGGVGSGIGLMVDGASRGSSEGGAEFLGGFLLAFVAFGFFGYGTGLYISHASEACSASAAAASRLHASSVRLFWEGLTPRALVEMGVSEDRAVTLAQEWNDDREELLTALREYADEHQAEYSALIDALAAREPFGRSRIRAFAGDIRESVEGRVSPGTLDVLEIWVRHTMSEIVSHYEAPHSPFEIPLDESTGSSVAVSGSGLTVRF